MEPLQSSRSIPSTGTYIAVGIDMGLTSTGIAYSSYDHGSDAPWDMHTGVKYIQKWFGHVSDIHHKCPTEIAYKDTSSESKQLLGTTSVAYASPTSSNINIKFDDLELKKESFQPWGFACDPYLSEIGLDHSKYKVKKHFKLKLASEHPAVEACFVDFLTALYNWIEGELRTEPEFSHETKVEYIFSVPTVWKASSNEIEKFEKCIKKAGYDTYGRCFTIGLTEAEAAAIYFINMPKELAGYKIDVDDTLIVCDAGGGTTDTTILTVKSESMPGIYKMEQLATVEGGNIGSVQIDRDLLDIVYRKLDAIPEPRKASCDVDLHDVQNLLRTLKHGLGTDTVDLLRFHEAKIKDYEGATYSEADISNGKMRFYLNEIEQVFDSKISAIINLVDKQLEKIRRKNLQVQKYLALSGGLGSSHYVRKKLADRYGNSSMKVIQASQFESNACELAVCRGLVVDQMLRVTKKIESISRLSRASYGVLFNEKFSKQKHKGQTPKTDPIDGKKYAKYQIEWLVNQNDQIAGIPAPRLSHRFKRNIGDNFKWEDAVVVYTGPVIDRLPTYLRTIDGTKDLRVIKIDSHLNIQLFDYDPPSDSESAPAAIKRYKHSWMPFRRGKYWEIEYTIHLTIGAAHVGVELIFNKRSINSIGVISLHRTEGMRNDSEVDIEV